MVRRPLLISAVLLSCFNPDDSASTGQAVGSTGSPTTSTASGHAESTGGPASDQSAADASAATPSNTSGVQSTTDTTASAATTSESDTSPAPARRVFVSSAVFPANFGSVAAADAKCQSAAESAGLSGTFLAWISAPMNGASDRMAHAEVPYVRIDGLQLAANWTDLTDGDLGASIEIDEWGNMQSNGDCGNVWTGTLRDGTPDDENACTGWTMQQGYVMLGRTDVSSYTWSEGCIQDCTKERRLFCLEQ